MNAACSTRLGSALACGLLLALTPTTRSAEIKLPDGSVVAKVDFERHVMGVFGRMGCNSGSCHGSFQGKGGFRLSLFGYDPEKDYLAISREGQGRRIDRNNPDNSLLLLKATGRTRHEGGMRFDTNSWAYHLMREWIAQGAQWTKGSGDVKAITITPPEYSFTRKGQKGQLVVKATFGDGSTEAITPLCDFRSNDDAVADVSTRGELRSINPGDTAVIVSYRGHVLPVRVMVPMEVSADFKYPKVAEVNFIDHEVLAKLKRLNMAPSELAGDNEFLRRVYLDTIGTLPTPEEVRTFQQDKRADKRARKIDDLLEHPMHAALWATKFCDITGNNTDALENPQQLRPKLSQMWHDWFRKRVAENMPYDEIVKGVLCATTAEGKKPAEWVKEYVAEREAMAKGFDNNYAKRASLDLFWRRQQAVTVDQWGEKTAAAFLGVRLECAQCHKHPFDRWTQVDYRAYANIFAPVSFGVSNEARTVINEAQAELRKGATGKNNNQIPQVREVFLGTSTVTGKGVNVGKPLPHPETGARLDPKALGGPEIAIKANEDPRVTLFEWMRQENNPFFARSFVNRVWGHYLGVGIVHPVDDFSLANPASNDKLLNALAKNFVQNKYDIRRLERVILNSRTYQTTSKTNDTNKFDRINYAHAYVRPMMAEIVVDALDAAIGVQERWGPEAPPNARAIEVGASRLNNRDQNYVFRVFGRPPRSTACDCERSMEAGLPQKLYLMADKAIKDKIESPSNRLKTLLSTHKDDMEAVNDLYLATLTRLPTDDERKEITEYLARKKDRQKAFQDLLWALVNTSEFIFNH
jgi:hypothetical protein